MKTYTSFKVSRHLQPDKGYKLIKIGSLLLPEIVYNVKKNKHHCKADIYFIFPLLIIC